VARTNTRSQQEQKSSLTLPISWIPATERLRHSETTLAKISAVKTTLIHKDEQSFALQLDALPTTGVSLGREMPYSERVVTTLTGGGWVSASVSVLVQCSDGHVLTRRALNISEPGKIYPVCESLSMEDVDEDGVLHITAGAVRGLREELGIEVALHDLTPGNACITDNSLLTCFSVRIPLSFEEIRAAWSEASHRDEGTPLLFNFSDHRRIVSQTVPQSYFTETNLAPFLTSNPPI
jgi:hypothetical protein